MRKQQRQQRQAARRRRRRSLQATAGPDRGAANATVANIAGPTSGSSSSSSSSSRRPAGLGVEVITGYTDAAFEWGGETFHIAPRSVVHAADELRSCRACRGCAHHLRRMPRRAALLGTTFAHETGASPGWLLRAASRRSRTGWAAVKVWCVPLKKPGARAPPGCRPERVKRQLQVVLAHQRVAADCGLSDVLPAHWVAPAAGVLPGGGYRLDWDGLWAELARGASLENVVARGRPPPAPGAVVDLLQRRVNSSDVVAAAVFDLLTSQCDRHGENVFVSAAGRLALIDSDQAYGSSWRACGADSIFLPGTQKHEVARSGFNYTMKRAASNSSGGGASAGSGGSAARPSEGASPLQLLDYRCHVARAGIGGSESGSGGGVIGTAYPPRVAACLKRIAAMSADDALRRYGFPQRAMAVALRRRAIDMSTRGFEWTLQHGWPRNPLPMRYRWGTPCCRMAGEARPRRRGGGGGGKEEGRHGGQAVYRCLDGWARGGASGLPRGDPMFGGRWPGPGRDPGTYELREDEGGVGGAGGGNAAEPEQPGATRQSPPPGWVAGAWLGDDDGAPDPGYAPDNQTGMYN